MYPKWLVKRIYGTILQTFSAYSWVLSLLNMMSFWNSLALILHCRLYFTDGRKVAFFYQSSYLKNLHIYIGWHKKTWTFEKPNKNWRNPRKKFIDRKWTITTCFLRDSNPNYQCLKITSCRWRPPPRMHSFTATTHFKSFRSFVSPCVCCMLCRMRQSRIMQSMQHAQNGNFWNA